MPIAKSTVEFSVRQDVENVFRRIQLKNLLENFFHDKKMTKHDRIPFSLTFHPRNNPVKAIIFNNFKILQNDPETGAFFSQPPLISFKRDKNVGNFLVKNTLTTS